MTLWALWYASLALAALSVLVMLGLVAHRVFRSGRDRVADARRNAISTALVEFLDGAASQEQVLSVSGGRIDLLAELVTRMRELVRGDDASRLVEIVRASGGFASAVERLRRRDPLARIEAVRHLVIYGQDASPILSACLSDPNTAVRVAAATELMSFGATPALRTLAVALDVGQTSRSDGLRQVFRPAVAANLDEAVALLKDGRSSEALCVLLLDGLAQAGALGALEAVKAATRDPFTTVRAEALRTLGAFGHPLAAPEVLAALSDPSWWVRAQAANAARRIGVVEAVRPLERLLKDRQWWVRLRAAEALSSLGPPGLASLRMVSRRDDDAGRIAQVVLAEAGFA